MSSGGTGAVALAVGAKLTQDAFNTVLGAFKDLANAISDVLTAALTDALKSIVNLMKTVVVGGVISITAALTGTVIVAGQLEQKFLDIRKVLDVSAEGFEKIKLALRETANTMTGMPLDRLLKAAEIGASAGIDPEKLPRFSKDVAIGSVALGIDSEKVATKMVEMSKIFERPTEEIKNFISAINELENKTTATAEQIFNITNRFAASAAQAHLFTYEAAALGTAMAQGGVSAEIAGTALTKFFQAMSQQGHMDAAAKAVHMTSQEFQQLWKGTPLVAIQKLSEAFRALRDDEKNAFMASLGFTDKRYNEAMKKLLMHGEDIGKNAGIAETAFVSGTSAFNEYLIRSQSLLGLWEQMKNRIELMAEAIGNRLMPGVKAFVQAIGDLANIVKGLQDVWGPWMDKISGGFATIATMVRNPIQALAILKSYLQEFWDNVPGMALAAVDGILSAFKGLALGIIAVLGTAIDYLIARLELMFTKIVNKFTQGKNADFLNKGVEEVENVLKQTFPQQMAKAFGDAFGGAFQGFKMPGWQGRDQERKPLWSQIAGGELMYKIAEKGAAIYQYTMDFYDSIQKALGVAKEKTDRIKNVQLTDAPDPKDVARAERAGKFAQGFAKEVAQMLGIGKEPKPFKPEIMDPESFWKRIQTAGTEDVLDIDKAILAVAQRREALAKVNNEILVKVQEAVEKEWIKVEK